MTSEFPPGPERDEDWDGPTPEEAKAMADEEAGWDDGWDDTPQVRPVYDWQYMQAGRLAHDKGRPRGSPLILTLLPRRRRSWLAGWDQGKHQARQRDRETLASAVATLMEAVDDYGEARRAGYEGLEQTEAVAQALRVLVQACGQAPEACKEEGL